MNSKEISEVPKLERLVSYSNTYTFPLGFLLLKEEKKKKSKASK